ncbi:transposable element Tcb1 transposase isoform X1 [Hydra vulgaris]|uniref:transposable element Tcb1 transposase isoform X1 n=1 Tax=Hydra vulgaris TaxID=6087 RepID=UPI0032E9E8BD
MMNFLMLQNVFFYFVYKVMGKNSDLSPRKIGQIKVLLEDSELKQKEIARKLNISTQIVSLIKKKIERGIDVGSQRQGNCGRKKITTPRTDRKIQNMALKDRRATCSKISSMLGEEGISVSRKTVNNRLLEFGLKAYRPRKKPRLTENMKKARYDWAKQHESWTYDDWQKVVFSDESTIAILDDRVQTVRRRPGEEFLPECLKKTVKFPQKIMVWGAFSVHGTSRLYIVDGTMNQDKYIKVLESRLVPQIREWYGSDFWIFQQDSAPCHKSKKVMTWFQQNAVQVLPWPGNSPDMNPIENLWDILKNEIHQIPITTKSQLIERLIHVWFHSTKIKFLCKSLIESMPHRVKALILAKGGQTKY